MSQKGGKPAYSGCPGKGWSPERKRSLHREHEIGFAAYAGTLKVAIGHFQLPIGMIRMNKDHLLKRNRMVADSGIFSPP
jgi:uncharacterized protein (DUF885 family)